jgi:hypothetical protein
MNDTWLVKGIYIEFSVMRAVKIVMRVSILKVQNILHGLNSITCSTDSKYRTALTVYIVGTGFVSGI